MRKNPWLLALSPTLVPATTVFTGLPAATAAPLQPPPTKGEEPANGPDRNEIAATDPVSAAAITARGENKAGSRLGYPRQTQLRVFPDNPADKTIKLGLIPYHAIAPKLNDLQ